jgi:hypothetical protein
VEQRHLTMEVEAVRLAQREEHQLRVAAEAELQHSRKQVQALTGELLDAQVGCCCCL